MRNRVALGQEECAKTARAITSAEITTRTSEKLVGIALQSLCGSLLCVIANTGLARLHLAICAIALQRFIRAPQLVHMKSPVVVTKWTQKQSQPIAVHKVRWPRRVHINLFTATPDFKQADDLGHALRGSVHTLCPRKDGALLVVAGMEQV